MAQFTTLSRVKLLLNGDGVPFGSESKDRLRYKLRSVRRIPLPGSSTGISPSASSASALRRSAQHVAEMRVGVRDEGVGNDGAIVDLNYDYEFESDDLACFRGLVLDISYRPVNVVCWKRAICLEFMEKEHHTEKTPYLLCDLIPNHLSLNQYNKHTGILLENFRWIYERKPPVTPSTILKYYLKQDRYSNGSSRCPVSEVVSLTRADVLEYYDQTVSSPSGSFYIPAVLRVPHLLQVVKRRRIKNSLSRKNILYRDNYTCQYCSSHDSLTIDHVLPISRGGQWTWENLVAACAQCNSKKGQKTVDEANMKLKKTPKAPKDYDILAIPLTSTAIKMLKLRKGTPEEWRQYLSNEQ